MEHENNVVREPPKLVNVRRLDSIQLDVQDKTYFTDEGYLVDHPILTSVGIFEYKNPDGTIRRELRLPEHVFKKESLDSYKGKPIIITHKAGEVDKDNVAREQIGTIMTAGYPDGDDVRAEIIIHDTDKMKDCGLKELSLGYNLDLINEEGEWNGMKYDAIQTNITINHLALVSTARAGEQARLNIDGSDEPELKGGKLMANTKTDALTPEELEMAIKEFKAKKGKAEEPAPEKEAVATDKKDNADEANADAKKDEAMEVEVEPKDEEEEIVVTDNADSENADSTDKCDGCGKKSCDGCENKKGSTAREILDSVNKDGRYDGCKNDADTIEKMRADIDALSAALEKSLGDKEEPKVEEKKDNKDSSNDKSESLNMDSADEIIRQRLSICRMGDKLRLDGLEDMSIRDGKIAIIKEVLPQMRLDGKSDTYIDVAYDLALGEVKERTSTDAQREEMAKDAKPMNLDSAENISQAQKARERMINRKGGNE